MAVPSLMSFSIQGGEAEPRGPYLRVWENRNNDVGTLYGLVEVVAGPPRDVASIVWQGIEEGLRGSRFTLTRYLQNALQRGHQYLNEYAARGWRAGATLVSVRGAETYVAWAGPSLAYLLSDGALMQVGKGSRELRGAGVPLGDRGELVPHVAREKVLEGDVLLLSWTRLQKIANEDSLTALLKTGLENCTQALYRLASGESDFAVLVAGFGAALDDDVT